MTLADIRTLSRKLGRTNTSLVSDATQALMVYEAIREFSHDVGGIQDEAYLALSPRFDMDATMAFRITVTGGTNALTATDVAVTDTDANDQTGAQAATELQAQIRAAGPTTLTVTWDSDDYYFVIDSIDGTNITIAAPSGNNYADATLRFFGGTGASGAQTYTGAVPEDMGMEADLPSDFKSIIAVEWDKKPLDPLPADWTLSPEESGDPLYYWISDDNDIRLVPSPVTQKLFHVVYHKDASTTLASESAEPPFDADYHMAIVRRVAGMLLEAHGTPEMDRKAASQFGFYRNYVAKYVDVFGNRDTNLRLRRTAPEGFSFSRFTVSTE